MLSSSVAQKPGSATSGHTRSGAAAMKISRSIRLSAVMKHPLSHTPIVQLQSCTSSGYLQPLGCTFSRESLIPAAGCAVAGIRVTEDGAPEKHVRVVPATGEGPDRHV